MNYKKIYNQIIKKAKKRKDVSGYCESHHIKPKCLGGKDDKKNLVLLTAREHYLCHWILHKLHPKHPGLLYAFVAMYRTNGKQKRYINSRVFQRHREKMNLHRRTSFPIRVWFSTKQYRDYESKKMASIKTGVPFGTITNLLRVKSRNRTGTKHNIVRIEKLYGKSAKSKYRPNNT